LDYASERASEGASAADNLILAGRQLLEMHGGEIEVSGVPSRPELLVRLPVGWEATILVVDDNPDIVQLFQRFIGRGYRLVQATIADEALRLAREIRPDVVTLDVMMPGVDGWEILEELKSDPETRHIPVVVCSVLREGTLALSLGAAAFVAKPINQQALRAALEQYRPKQVR
jgi:CheY-like chemotaxis protein